MPLSPLPRPSEVGDVAYSEEDAGVVMETAQVQIGLR